MVIIIVTFFVSSCTLLNNVSSFQLLFPKSGRGDIIFMINSRIERILLITVYFYRTVRGKALTLVCRNWLIDVQVDSSKRMESTGNLQHISEREPDDWEEDPSLHPTTETMFMEKSKQSIRSQFTTKRCILVVIYINYNWVESRLNNY